MEVWNMVVYDPIMFIASIPDIDNTVYTHDKTPRILGSAISPTYAGTAIFATPSEKPAKTRATYKYSTDPAKAISRSDKRCGTAVNKIVDLRPKVKIKNAATGAPMDILAECEVTIQDPSSVVI